MRCSEDSENEDTGEVAVTSNPSLFSFLFYINLSFH